MRASECSRLASVAPWLAADGPESDVVLASRIRLSRNLSEHPYPGEGGSANEQATATIIAEAIRNELSPDPFDIDTLDLDPRKIAESDVGLLQERSVLEDELPLRVFLSSDESLSITLGSVDHLRIVTVSPGLSLPDALARVRGVDSVLEHYLNFAVSLDWGYLSTEILNVGTGMRASVLLHLPALVELSRLDSLTENLKSNGFDLAPYRKAHQDSMPTGLMQLSNTRTLGVDERGIVAELEDYTSKLVHYERTARDEIVAERGPEVADSAHRALGILRFARSLTIDEARTMVSELRMGVASGVVNDVTTRTATMLFPLIQYNHVIATRLRSSNTSEGEEDINAARAAVVRDALTAI